MKTPPNPRDVIVEDNSDLCLFWKSVIGFDSIDGRTLWLALFDEEGHPLPVLIPIEGVPARPDGMAANLATVIRSVCAEHKVGSVATLLARPGSATLTAGDHSWARMLDGEDTAPAKVWPAHLAVNGRVVRIDIDGEAVAS